ncbi:MAG: hypothetical protein AAF600_15165 [Bacteroidota bacterium]
MERIRIKIAILSIALLGCSKSNTHPESNLSKEFTEKWTEIHTEYAKNFKVAYHDRYKEVDLSYQSEGREIDFEQKLYLYPKGTQRPKIENDEGKYWFIEIPIETVAANEDGEITRLKSLGLINKIAGMGGGGIYDSELRKRWENKQITSIGYSFHSIPKPELLMSVGAELLVLHTYDNSRLEGMEKLRKLGINAIPQFAWAEPNFLAKAEWIKFTSLFHNEEEKANVLFERIKSRCNELITLVENYGEKATSFLLYYPSSNSDWEAHRNDFYASYLQAISLNVLKNEGPTHSVGITNEQLLKKAKDADFWIINSTEDTNWPPKNFLSSFKAYREGNVYHYQKRTRHEHNAYDWYETPDVRPDLVLEDLVSIFYPELLPNHTPMFFDKVKLTKK